MNNVPGDTCPFEFNFDPATFKVGDTVSYRVPEQFGDMPFVGILVAVGEDWVEISTNDPTDPDRRMRGTRASRPVVSAREALA
ncbi:MAG TPA: hypothetical protein PKE27_16040 [Povalibacter sp.]|uniref:hypothetical protein n=1 Tax=Povalibacter sp. TaxID=1962978 RepID=UPI002C7A4805|nr:hypothetical protein [Povalibacter sp.]HMN46089.1 hypothetical protein [Povalibacter sp.]